uniref:Ephrin-B2 isoform X1 n=1 Tax=Geotrypetes seraphini TaxID=260995 RepID=A0A6P8R8M5_GEOSA|nr:ephrin-B2 isoform X1 [Geotrypetes seraphini]XP_033804615.1 ephrin-B2 isoform X1 [Geotrypetes seraphini]
MAGRKSIWKYYWGALVILRIAISKSIDPIYWNSSNPKFHPGQGLILYPQMGDRLDIICPKVDSISIGQYEYFKVYMVDKEQADSCTIKKDKTPLLNCAKPEQDVKFTIKFQEFSPNLWGLEFQRNKNYYIISTSNGSSEGMDNKEGGVCHSKSMKIVMKVGQDPDSAGSSEDAVSTRYLEQEPGTNRRSYTMSPFVNVPAGASEHFVSAVPSMPHSKRKGVVRADPPVAQTSTPSQHSMLEFVGAGSPLIGAESGGFPAGREAGASDWEVSLSPLMSVPPPLPAPNAADPDVTPDLIFSRETLGAGAVAVRKQLEAEETLEISPQLKKSEAVSLESILETLMKINTTVSSSSKEIAALVLVQMVKMLDIPVYLDLKWPYLQGLHLDA